MNRYVLYTGYLLLVTGAIAIALALSDGIFVGASLLPCGPTSEPPFPPIEYGGTLKIRVYGIYDLCNYSTIHPWLTGGFLMVLVVGCVLGGDHMLRRQSTR